MSKETFPPTTPLKENLTLTLTSKGSGSGKGTGTDARACEDVCKGKGKVDIEKSQSQGKRVPISYDLIMDETHDPVEIALLVLRIPKCGIGTNGCRYNNARLLRWYLRRMDELSFRELVYQQWRENAIDGKPNCTASAFMAKLWKCISPNEEASRDNLPATAAP